MAGAAGGQRVLGLSAAALGLVAAVVGLVVAPEDAVQGPAQRLMYLHVPAAWTAYLAFATVLVASLAYLARRDLRWDARAQAGAEIGVGLTALAIALGSVWGRAVWGTWWTWDARLVTTVVLLLAYLGYLGARGLGDDPHLVARRSAALGVVAFLNVPLVHFSVVWWRTLHQPPTVLSPDPNPPIDPVMGLALGLALAAFTLAAAWVFRRRVARLVQASTPVADGLGSATPHGAPPAVTVLARRP